MSFSIFYMYANVKSSLEDDLSYFDKSNNRYDTAELEMPGGQNNNSRMFMKEEMRYGEKEIFNQGRFFDAGNSGNSCRCGG